MIKSNDKLKIPGQTRDKKRQNNNENNGIRVRLIIWNPVHYCGRSCESYFKSQLLLICEQKHVFHNVILFQTFLAILIKT